MIEFCNGNVLDADTDAIAQQVNCMGVMGAGLAKQIRSKYPAAYFDYKKACDKAYHPLELLGDCQFCEIGGTVNKVIFNLFGQYRYGRDKQYTELSALKNAMEKMRAFCSLYDVKSVAIPYGIGCGLGGADWEDVYFLIKLVFEDSPILIKIYSL